MTTATLPSIRSLSDDDLAGMVGGPYHDAAAAEIDRRDQAERKPRRQSGSAARYLTGPAAEWYEMAWADFTAAQAATNGYMLSKAGEAAGITDPFTLWRGPAAWANAMASEELRNRWDDPAHPRLTMTEYRRQVTAARRDEREEHEMGIIGQVAGQVGREMVRDAMAGQRQARQPVKAPASVQDDYEAAKRALRAEQATAVALHAPGGTMDGTVVPRPARQRDSEEAAALLRQVLEAMGILLTDYVEFPSRSACIAVILWIAQAACRDGEGDLIWSAYPRLLLTSRQNGSGKSTLGDFIALLLECRAGRMSKVTPYGLTKVLGGLKETAICDDAQNVFRGGKTGAELLSILINGYSKRATWVSGKSDGKIEPASGPVVVIGKDELLTKRAEDLADLFARCAPIVRMERPARYMPEMGEDAEDRAGRLAVALKAVTGALQGELKGAAKALAAQNAGQDITEGDGGRTAQVWRPLLAVAAVADTGSGLSRWQDAAFQAMDELSAASGDLVAVKDVLADLGSGSAGRSFWDDEISEEN